MTKPLDTAQHNIVEQWVDKAEEDYIAAGHLLTKDEPCLNVAAFLCHQSTEKFFKAFLVKHQIEFPKTHDLKKLLVLISNVDINLSQSLQGSLVLNLYGVTPRYPDDIPEPTQEEADNAYQLASELREKIIIALRK